MSAEGVTKLLVSNRTILAVPEMVVRKERMLRTEGSSSLTVAML